MTRRFLKFNLVIITLVLCIILGGCVSSPQPSTPSAASPSSSPAPEPASTPLNITIVNATGYTVWYVQVSPSDNDSWGPDLLDKDQELNNGESFIYQLPQSSSNVKVYDIRLIDSDEDTYTKWRVNVADNSLIIFTFDDIDLDEDDAS